MSESSPSTSAFPPLPIRERVIAGMKSGLIAGVYFAILMGIYSAIVHRPQSRFISHPVGGVLRIIAAFALAGAVFRILQPKVTNTLGAVAVGIVCTVIGVSGITTAMIGDQPNAYLAALGLGTLSGIIGAVIMWRGWYRQASRASST